MRFATYRDRSGRVLAGIISGDGKQIQPFRSGISLDDFIALESTARAAQGRDLGEATSLSDVTLLAPVHPKKNVFCVGRNYLAHAEEGARTRGEKLDLPEVPTYFTKAPTAIAGPGQDLELDPGVSPNYDFEAELAVVIGQKCRDVPESRALEVIFGYSCLNDVTARDLQRAHVQWFKGKSLDQTCPIGPWIVEASEIGDPQTLGIRLTVNGVEKQNSNTKNMIYPIRTIIANLTRGLTLEPGDVIATGTPEGVGYARKPPEWLGDADVMEVIIEKVGTLKNTVRLRAPVGAGR